MVHRGPAYTQYALYGRVNSEGELELINELGLNLGSVQKILNNLENKNYSSSDFEASDKLGSDDKYAEIVRGLKRIRHRVLMQTKDCCMALQAAQVKWQYLLYAWTLIRH